MRLGLGAWLLIGAVVGGALPLYFYAPSEAVWHAPWTALFGIFAVALAFASIDHAERHHLNDDGGGGDA